MILVPEGVQGHGAALGPEPHAVGGELALGAALLVDGVVVQDLVGQLHQVLQYLGVVVAGGQQGADDLAQVVVGRDEFDAHDVRAGLHRNVPEGSGGMHDHPGLLGSGLEFGVVEQVRDQLNGLVALDGAAGVGEDLLLFKGQVAVFQSDHVAAIRNVTGLELDAGGSSFQRGAAGIAHVGVCAENGQDGGVTAGGQAVGAVDDVAHLALGGQGIHHGNAGVLEGGLVVQGGDGVVCHAVTDDEDILHGISFPEWGLCLHLSAVHRTGDREKALRTPLL